MAHEELVQSVDLATALSALGLPPEALPELTTRINMLPWLTRIGGIGSLGKLQAGYE
jgi:hypothetical protein